VGRGKGGHWVQPCEPIYNFEGSTSKLNFARSEMMEYLALKDYMIICVI